MKIEIIETDPIDSDTFGSFIHLIGLEFEEWKREKHEEKEEIS